MTEILVSVDAGDNMYCIEANPTAGTWSNEKSKLLELCIYAIAYGEQEIIERIVNRSISEEEIEETAEAPRAVHSVKCTDDAIAHTLYINGKLCSNLDNS